MPSSTTECYKGWSKEDGNMQGRCCCNCRYQRPIVGHPCNKTSLTRTSIMRIIGHGCTVPDMENIVFFDSKHGMCEMHEYKIDNVIKLVKKDENVQG